MQQKLRLWNDWLSSHMFLVVLFALFMGFFLQLPASPVTRFLVIALFGYMTFITSLSISFTKFIEVLRQPWIPLWTLSLIHFITPLAAWLVGRLLYPDDFLIRIGYLICACIPVGVTSVIWTELSKGNTAISLVTVTLDTLLVPLLLPLYFKLILGQSLQINYTAMIVELLAMITLPSLLGMAVHDWTKGKAVHFAKHIGGFTSKIGFFGVILISAGLVAPEVHWSSGLLKTLLVTLFIVTAGYFLGYLGSFITKEQRYDTTIAMIYNVGLRNLSFGLVLALTYFPAAAALPITLGMLFQQPIAAIIPYIYKQQPPQKETSVSQASANR
ncbi:putative Na+-dependent transporter [Anaerospora hongkongensis]|uniref:Putative Na+-dependent transporter n=1 Tax=Anaerospora hongkongensis TaxID=244830 RepID=A0A4R1PMZ1_9FIRM|nr:bile acid:sodium symporter [Anaerospora hongkongensis]TCL32685.1 putative Na+-dependent transporter [Anaerospora hongkongensis]